MTENERQIRNAYQRGYGAGRRREWPLHKPPIPPEELTGRMVRALVHLADAVDGECAKFDADDPMVELLMRYVDAARDALAALGEHCC